MHSVKNKFNVTLALMLKYCLVLLALGLLPGFAIAEEAAVPTPSATYAGSCVLESMCIETSSDFTVIQAQNNCKKIKGQYSAEHCPKTDVIGSCHEKTKSSKAYTTYYYSKGNESDPEEIALDCKFRSGNWNQNDSSVALNN